MRVSDAGSVNGIVIGTSRHHGAQHLELPAGEMLKIGHTRLRVRTAHETLPPEKPDRIEPASIVRTYGFVAAVAGLVVVAQLIYLRWLEAPRDLAAAIVVALTAAALAGGVWVAFWALISRVLQWEWRWLRHAAILLSVAAIFVVVDGLLDLVWFAFSLPQWGAGTIAIATIGFGCALYFHMQHASGISPRNAALVACLVPAVVAGAGYWVMRHDQMRDVNYIGASLRIYPPALRVRSAKPVETYFRDVAELRGKADARRAAMPVDDEANEAKDDGV
jgi:hypothetical protein